MPFRRRAPLAYPDRLRRVLLPSMGLHRSVAYCRLKVLRMGGSPHAVALGIAIGVFIAWTPLLGLHVIAAIPLAYLLGGSMVAAAIGTTFANPLTFALIWPLTWEIGQVLLGRDVAGLSHIDFAALFHHLDLSQLWRPVLEPMLIGSVPPGMLSGLVFYSVTYWSVRSFRRARLQRLTARAGAIKSV